MDPISKGTLIERVQKSANDALESDKLSKKTVTAVVNATIDEIMKATANNEKVTLLGFGSFEVTDVKERPGRNPQTGEPCTVPAHKKVHFKVSRSFTKAINGKE